MVVYLEVVWLYIAWLCFVHCRVGGADGGAGDQLMTTRVVHERKVRREIANSNERKRMQSINAGFQSLRLLLPRTGAVDRLSKVSAICLCFCRVLPPINIFMLSPCVQSLSDYHVLKIA